MDWIVFSYSLPSNSSTPRVTLWRRLRRLGAISPTGSVYVLPAQEECVEAFQWLAREAQQASGEALVMRVSQFEGVADAQLIEQFNRSRQEEYENLAGEIENLSRQITPENDTTDWPDALTKLQRQYAEIARVDYFQSPQGMTVSAQLNQLAYQLLQPEAASPEIQQLDAADYQGKKWVTRPRPFVDRLACAWLIRRFLDETAAIRYAPQPEPDEIPFDMNEGLFSHQGNLCTFEVMIQAFGLSEPGLPLLAQIVHEIDLPDGRFQRLETQGIEAILRGWQLGGLSDSELEERGIILFEGLFAALSPLGPGDSIIGP